MALVIIVGEESRVEEGSRVKDVNLVVIEGGVLLCTSVSYSVIIIVTGLLFLGIYDQRSGIMPLHIGGV